MIKVIKDIPDYAFSSQLPSLEVHADKTVTFILEVDAVEVFRQIYTPDNANRIIIRDLRGLMWPFLQGVSRVDARYQLTAVGETAVTRSFRVHSCAVDVPADAVSFVNRYFLSCLVGRDKVTVPGRLESVALTVGTYTAAVNAPVKVHSVYVDAGCKRQVVERQIGVFNGTGVQTFLVSPDLFKVPGLQLIRYTVTCGSRKQVFRVQQGGVVGVGFKFRNVFGVMEYAYLSGTGKVKPVLEREEMQIDGQLRTFLTAERREHTVSSGVLSDAELLLVDDLARSPEVYLLEGNREIRVAIVDADTERDSDDHNLHRAEITYVKAGMGGEVKLMPEIFDDSFDVSFE